MLIKSSFRFGAAVVAAIGCGAMAHAGVTSADGVLTVDGGETLVVASETELLGKGTSLTNVTVDASTLSFQLTADQTGSKLTYRLCDGAKISVSPAARSLQLAGVNIVQTSAGNTFEKTGPGKLLLGKNKCGVISRPTRFIVSEGTVQIAKDAGDQFGSHSTTTTNLVIDVREGATWHNGFSHAALGPVELTGATLISENTTPYNNYWADTSFKGGVTAHASATASKMYAASWFFLGQPSGSVFETNCVFDVETGAELFVYGKMRSPNGYASKLVKRGGGTLYLMDEGSWTGGTVIEGGKIVLGHAKALGTKAVTLAGDAELAAVPGVTASVPELKGSGAVTVSGTGGLTFGTVASGVTGAVSRTADPFEPVEDGVLKLVQIATVVNVAAGETVTVTNIDVAYDGLARTTDIRKTGAGTLVLGSGLKGKYRQLIVEDGVVEFTDDTSFGTSGIPDAMGSGKVGGVSVTGGKIRPAKDYTQKATRFTFTGTDGGLDVPAGVTFTAISNCFYSANATVTKTGAGVWQMGAFMEPQAVVSGTRWVIDEGRLSVTTGSAFASHLKLWSGTIEVHENGVFETTGACPHQPVGLLVLRGGTVRMPISQFNSSAFYTEGGGQWRGYAFNGGIKVLASAQKSQIIARACFTAHGSYVPVIDVEDGATLELNTALDRGRDAPSGRNSIDGDLVKAGKGTLRLLRPLSLRGTFDIQDGTVELAEGGYIDPAATVRTAPGAKFILNDGTRFVSNAELVPDIVRTADVWIDATRLAASDGATLSSIPNRGTAGGSFVKFPTAVSGSNGMIPNAPKFVAAGKGIGGKASVGFDGTMALALDSYENLGTNCEMFVVAAWTNFYNASGKGKWGGIVSLGSTSMTANEDQYNWGVLSTSCTGNDKSAVSNTVVNISVAFGNATINGSAKGVDYGRATATLSSINPVIENGDPFILRIQRGDKSGCSELWRGDSVAVATKTTSYSVRSNNINRVALGTRLMKGGCATTYSSGAGTRNLIGQIGEVLVYTKALTAAERAAVSDYLRRKWIGTTADAPSGKIATVEVETAAGAETAFVVGAGNDGNSHVEVTKTGAGAAVIGGGSATVPLSVAVEEGTIRLQSASLASRVPVWIDMDDASVCLTAADGSVTNLANKGFCGGSFTLAQGLGETPHYPTRTANGINGRATLTFDGEAALVTDAYTNKVASRRFSVYAVGRRNSWRLSESGDGGYGKWATPFTFVPRNGLQDESQFGVFHFDENKEKRGYADFGSYATGEIDVPALGEPLLFVAQVTTNGYYLSFETNATDVAKVPRAVNGSVANLEPMQVERIFLGARSKEGKVHYYGSDNTANRCWYGDLAEVIVTTEPLSYDEEIELLAYLRKKWLNKGDGSATPPAWLSGAAAAPQFGATSTLALADGTTLVDAADELTLGALETQGATTWERVWDGTDENFPFFTVAGDVSLGSVKLRLAKTPTDARILSFGAEVTAPTWSAERPNGRSCDISVLTRDNAYYIGKPGLVLFVR